MKIVVNLQVEGFHSFPAARDLFPEVGFLADTHRHIFHICCKKVVSHDDRDIEIILFKRKIIDYLTKIYGGKGYCHFGAMSCEMIARELTEAFELSYCSVLEDGENGAEYEP